MSRLTICTVLLALGASACNSTPTNPTQPTPDPIADVYKGTLGKNDAERFSFVTGVSGALSAQIILLNPADLIVGLGLGVFNQTSGTCSVMLSNERATTGTLIEGNSDRAGTLCVRIFDVGNVVEPADYEIRVIHQ